MLQGSVLSVFLLAVVVDVVIEYIRCALCELQHADGLILIFETTKRLQNEIRNYTEHFKNKGLNVGLR